MRNHASEARAASRRENITQRESLIRVAHVEVIRAVVEIERGNVGPNLVDYRPAGVGQSSDECCGDLQARLAAVSVGGERCSFPRGCALAGW